MAANPLTTAALANAVDRRIRKHFLDTYPTVEPKLDKVFKIDQQEDLNEYEEDYQGLTQYQATAEADTYKQDNFGEGYQTIYTPTKFTKSVPITMESQTWDKSMITKSENIGAEMARAAADTIETQASSVLNNGFNTSFTSYGDSKPAFSTLHTRPDGGSSQSNASSTGLAYSGEAMETIFLALRSQKNKRGRLVRAVPKTILVPPALEAEALRVTQSFKQANTADNNTNVFNIREYYGGNIKVLVWEYLGATVGGSDTAWFVLDDDLQQLTWKWAKKPSVKRDDTTGIQNDTLYFLGMFYASKGWSDWVGTYGSKGDGLAYSS